MELNSIFSCAFDLNLNKTVIHAVKWNQLNFQVCLDSFAYGIQISYHVTYLPLSWCIETTIRYGITHGKIEDWIKSENYNSSAKPFKMKYDDLVRDLVSTCNCTRKIINSFKCYYFGCWLHLQIYILQFHRMGASSCTTTARWNEQITSTQLWVCENRNASTMADSHEWCCKSTNWQ